MSHDRAAAAAKKVKIQHQLRDLHPKVVTQPYQGQENSKAHKGFTASTSCYGKSGNVVGTEREELLFPFHPGHVQTSHTTHFGRAASPSMPGFGVAGTEKKISTWRPKQTQGH